MGAENTEQIEALQQSAANLEPEAPEVLPETEPPKRRPGRPKKTPELETEKIPGTSAKPSAAKPKKRNSSSVDLQAMGKQIAGLHSAASLMTGIPELQITIEEGVALAQAVTNVCDEYDLSIDGKTGAFIQLLMTAGMVYAPRLLHMKARARAAQEAANVVPAN